LKDCTLHVVGLRQTLRLEGLTRGFDLTAQDNLARVVANASLLPPGAVSISVSDARRLAESGVVTLELSMSSDDSSVGIAALSLSSLSTNTPFLSQASSALGETSLSVSVTGNLSAVDGAGAEVVQEFISTTTTSTTSTSSSDVSGVSTSDTSSSTSTTTTQTIGTGTVNGSPTGTTSDGQTMTTSLETSDMPNEGQTTSGLSTTDEIEGGLSANTTSSLGGKSLCFALTWPLLFLSLRPEQLW